MLRCLLTLATLATFVGHAPAQTAKSKSPKDEEVAIAHCLELIRGSQLPSGAIGMTAPGPGYDAPVWIQQYFGAHAALALLCDNPDTKVAAGDLKRVGKWLEWCVKHQEKGGYWCDHVGSVSKNKSNGAVDAHDSSAAMFLVVVARYQRAGGKVTNDIKAAATASLRCIDNVTDKDGLTWAKPDYKVKYLMDNVEVYAGLVSAARYLDALGEKEESKKVQTKATELGESLVKFWEAKEKGRYAWALHPNGHFDGGMDKMYPQGLAQLFAVACVGAEAAPFREVAKTFLPENQPESAGSERYLMAAVRVGTNEEKAEWRKKTIKVGSDFNTSVYVFRPALVVLALREGADWMPSLLEVRKK